VATGAALEGSESVDKEVREEGADGGGISRREVSTGTVITAKMG
jgi:hypothetical protein